ncbi:MAG: hypothetical protein WC738_06575, partial [Candidatus Omnitrophota bacterium]
MKAKVILLTAIFVCMAVVAGYAAPVYLYWGADWKTPLKRSTLDSGEIYEYYNEIRVPGSKGGGYGRLTLAYKPSTGGYMTWDWDTLEVNSQVVVSEYTGIYTPPNNYAWNEGQPNDIQASELRTEYIYDYYTTNASWWQVDTTLNGWIERQKTIYDTDGTTVLEKYLRDTTGRLVKDIHTGVNTYYTYIYHTSPGMENVIHYKEEYTYNEADEASILAGTAGTFVASYEYIDTNYMVKREKDAGGNVTTITTLILDAGGNSHNNTYLDLSNNVLHVYNWDASWNLLSVKKYYPNGNVEICTPTSPSDPVWPLVEKVEPDKINAAGDYFIKGVNLPWVNYGYSLGLSAKDGSHLGFSRSLEQLYDKMDSRKGDVVRIFLFTDFRAGLKLNTDGTIWTDALGNYAFTDKVYEDMQALLDSARALGVKLMPVLFDFTIADGKSGADLGEFTTLITDASMRQKLVTLFSDFITTFGNDSSIYAWDIMNEPECASAIVNFSDLQAFVAAFRDLIHTNAVGAKVTVGSLNRTTMVNNWKGMGLDIYQFHYYDSMESTNPLDYEALLLGLDKPIIAGELDPTNVVDKLNTLNRNGYAGGLFWEDESGYTISDADYAAIEAWYDGTKYTYYQPSGRLESVTKTTVDTYGNVYYHYMNEDFYTDLVYGSKYGRVDKQVLGAVDSDNAIAYEYDYFTDSSIINIKRCYQSADYSDSSNPILTTLLITYEYNSSGVIVKKTLASGDFINTTYYASGNKQYDAFFAPGWAWQKTIEYYDAKPSVMHYQWVTDANPGVDGDDVYYEYDTNEKLVFKRLDTGESYTYDSSNRIISHTLASGDFINTTYYASGNKQYDAFFAPGWAWQKTIEYYDAKPS